MLHLFRLLSFLINIDQETILKWFGLEDNINLETYSLNPNNYYPNFEDTQQVNNISFNTLLLVIQGLWNKVQDGLTLADIENIVFFILFIRFVILSIRYNLKTSFYITCIGFFAGYLWYRHLIDLISMYRSVLLKLPFLHKLGMDAIQLRSLNRQMVLTNSELGENSSWSNPGQVLYYAFTKGIVHVDSETGLKYYIDPISMFIANLKEPTKSNIVPLYYKVYNKIIPKIFDICSKFWTQLSGVAAYAVITRIGKRYCPYLVRWHWTFLLIIGMIEQIFIYFIYRVYYFQTFVLIPQTKSYTNFITSNLNFQINLLNGIIICIVLIHIGFIIFGLFHAIWGQYFYIPFFVENTELHIGPRPKNSLYSGGNTAWQEPEEKRKNLNLLFPKLWYGWFGRGTKNSSESMNIFQYLFKNIWLKITRQFKK